MRAVTRRTLSGSGPRPGGPPIGPTGPRRAGREPVPTPVVPREVPVYLSRTEAALLPPALPTTLTTAPAARRGRRLWPLLGPAFVASVAYVDPGNFATNF